MDLYYDSSMGNVDKEIQDILSRASELNVDEVSGKATVEDLTKDCLDGKEKAE